MKTFRILLKISVNVSVFESHRDERVEEDKQLNVCLHLKVVDFCC